MNKLLTAAVMATTALAPIASTAAYGAVTNITPPIADAADGATIAAMQSQCAAAALAADLDGSDPDSDRYSAEVVEGATSLVSGPTEVGTEGARDIDLSTRVGAGTFTPGVRFIDGNPYRNGGSVNMFGLQKATGGSYSNSMYDFTADFASTFANAFSCAISKEEFHPAVFMPAQPVQGYYIVDPDAQGNEEAKQNSCNAFTAIGPTAPFWGMDQGQCQFFKTADATDEVNEPAYFDPPEPVGSVDGTPVNQNQTDSLMAHETFGMGFTVTEVVTLGQVVVCISPSKSGAKLPGAWTRQNGYTGDRCTTAWYSGTTPYSPGNYAGTNVPNLNDGSHNLVTVPIT